MKDMNIILISIKTLGLHLSDEPSYIVYLNHYNCYTGMDDRSIHQLEIRKYRNGSIEELLDTVAVESPLEIQIARHGQRPATSISVTMRTPGQDKELALGFLFTEGVLDDPTAIESIAYPLENVIRIILKSGSDYTLHQQERHFYTTSSCGVCAKSSIEAIQLNGQYGIETPGPVVPISLLTGILDKINSAQTLFELTGGIHAAALFDCNGNLKALYEDVGRHNALDKLIGCSISDNALPLHNHIVFLSGRASFELVQKAYMAAVPIIVAVGAPSTLAVSLARDNGQTLVGFLKNNALNIYSGHERIQV
jgi:FdhD protein